MADAENETRKARRSAATVEARWRPGASPRMTSTVTAAGGPDLHSTIARTPRSANSLTRPGPEARRTAGRTGFRRRRLLPLLLFRLPLALLRLQPLHQNLNQSIQPGDLILRRPQRLDGSLALLRRRRRQRWRRRAEPATGLGADEAGRARVLARALELPGAATTGGRRGGSGC